MPLDFVLNDRYLRTVTDSGYVSIADTVSLSGGNRVQATIDLQFDALPGTTRTFCGKSATADFGFSITSAGIVTFTVRRSGGNASSTLSAAQALRAGLRYVLTGIDDGSTVKLYVNGTVAATTASSASGAIVADTNPAVIGAEAAGANPSRIYLWAFQWQRDDITVCRFFVREESGVVLHDTSGYGNNGAVQGVEGTDFFYGRSSNFEPVWPGATTL